MLERALHGDSLAAVVVEAVFGVEQKASKLRFNTVDGCATNGVANVVMKAIFRECCDIICISHTSNLSMALFERTTKVAHKFISLWSQCLTQGHKVRLATQASLGEKGIKSHAIRWMAEYRASVQIFNNLEKIEEIIRNEDVGCASLIGQLLEIIDGDRDNLRLELALLNDSGEPIAAFCNHFEGDGYLAPYVYNKWNGLADHMTHILENLAKPEHLSAVRRIACEIGQGDKVIEDQLIDMTVQKAKPVAQKLQSDTLGRLGDTMQIFRASRLLGYQFARDNNYEALLMELEYLHFLPVAVPLMDQLTKELKKYKEKAALYLGDDDWNFWRSYCNIIPTWYRVAAEVALVMSSSASVERVFSLLNSRFTDQQQRCLKDYKEGSIRITYNEIFRDRLQYQN